MADLVTIEQVKPYLGVGGAGVPARTGAAPATAADDAVLASLIAAATPVIEDLTGPILPRVIVAERHDGDGSEIMLDHAPLLSVQSVRELRAGNGVLELTESTPAARIDGYQVEYGTGRLIRVTSGIYESRWWPGVRNIEVSYTAGRASVPPSVTTATCELIAHWWRRRRGGANGFAPSGEPGYMAGMGYGVPNFVLHVLGPVRRAPSIG